MVGLVGLKKWSIQTPFKKKIQLGIYMINTFIINDSIPIYKEKWSQTVNQSSNMDECIKYLAESMKWIKKKEVIAKSSGKGSICPICANQNREDLYPE